MPALTDWVAYRARTLPDRTAVQVGQTTCTYAALDAEVAHVARALAERGVRAGDRVATLLENGLAPVLMVHAALRLRVTMVPLNTRLSDIELTWQLRDAAPRMLIVDAKTAAAGRRIVSQPAGVSLMELDALRSAASNAPNASLSADHVPIEMDAESVLAIIYTSGTTGRPKGAMLTVGNFWWSAIGSALNLGTHSHDRWLACLPLFHVGGLSILLRAAIYGVDVVIHEGFDASRVNGAIDEQEITMVSLVAVMLQRMLDARGSQPFPHTLRTVLVGGGPLPRTLLDRAVRLGVPVAPTYGLTETASQVATLPPEEARRKPGSVGRPLYPNELRIVRAPSAAASDDAGEILVRGPVVTAGYAGDTEFTTRAIVDGWLHTGDIGRLDDDGCLYVLDRRDDLIITGGENVYPAEVEAALLAFDGVDEAAVIGVADAEWGQRVVAVVRLHDAASADVADALRAHCRSRLAGYKVPREIRIVSEPLPRTASGKLRRAELSGREASLT